MASKDKVFSLQGKALKLDTAEDLEKHIGPLRAMEDVEEVVLQGNTLGVEASKRLGEVLATKKNLKAVDLSDIFTGRLLNEIPEALSHLLTSIVNLPNLRTINLNDNAFGINTFAPVAAFLSSHVPLQHLFLNNNGLGPDAGMRIANALSELHAKKEEARKAGQADVPDLETIICGRNRLENGSMLAWARTFSLHDKVKEVKMVQNGIRMEGVSHLLKGGLAHTKSIRVLDLQDNTFTLTGAHALANVAPTWTELRELGVGDALLGVEGGKLFSKALAKGHNVKLETLRLQYNEIDADAVKGLASAAKEALPALRKIELNGNFFSEDDESILVLQELLEERKEALGGDVVLEDDWGLDELDEVDEEGEEDEPAELLDDEEIMETLLKAEKEATEKPVIPIPIGKPALPVSTDKDVEELTKKLEKTAI